MSYFPGELADTCPALLSTERIRQGTTVYIEQQTHQRAASVACSVWCQPAGPIPGGGAEHLQLPHGVPVLVVATTTCNEDGQPMTYEIDVHPPDIRVPVDPVAI
jgi:GntR family transcriptional regulator